MTETGPSQHIVDNLDRLVPDHDLVDHEPTLLRAVLAKGVFLPQSRENAKLPSYLTRNEIWLLYPRALLNTITRDPFNATPFFFV